MKLVELFDITEPDMLLEAAKDRYMQMLPDSIHTKFVPVPDDSTNAMWAKAKEGFGHEVKWAMSQLNRADRIIWFLRFAKMRAINDFLVQIKQYDAEYATSTGGDTKYQETRVALEKYAVSERRKLEGMLMKDTNDLIEQIRAKMDKLRAKLDKTMQECQGRNDNNCRSRITNAQREYQAANAMNQQVVTLYHRGSLQNLNVLIRNNVEKLTKGGGWDNLVSAKGRLEHYMGIGDVRIQNFKYGAHDPTLLFIIFNKWEEEWSEKQKRVIAHDDPSWEGAEKIIDFGDGFAWWNLHRSYCQREGQAMGHCGNSYRSDRPVEILTLRQQVDDGKGNIDWKVCLTFIWNMDTGMIEESKGGGNLKPKEEYHPYIIELLRQPWIKGFNQAGTHKPEENFDITDLEQGTQDELADINPRLIGAVDKEEFEKGNKLYKVYMEGEPYPDGSAWFIGGEETILEWVNDNFTYALPMTVRGEEFWVPKIEIIFNNKGLATVTGVKGEKPEHEYYNVIMDALKHFDEIKSLTVSDYGEFFTLNDISEPEREELFRIKPSFATPEYIYKRLGVGEEFVEKVNQILDQIDEYHEMDIQWETYDDEFKAFPVGIRMPLQTFLEERSSENRNGIWVYKLLTGDEFMDFYESPSPDSSESETILDGFKKAYPDRYEELVNHVVNEFFEEESQAEYDFGTPEKFKAYLMNTSDLVDFAETEDIGDIKQAFDVAHRRGLEIGAENEAYEHFEGYLKNLHNEDTGNRYEGYDDNSVFYKVIPDQGCYTCDSTHVQQYISIDFIFDALASKNADDLKLDYWQVRGLGDAPYGWGYTGYDLGAAVEEFDEAVYEIL